MLLDSIKELQELDRIAKEKSMNDLSMVQNLENEIDTARENISKDQKRYKRKSKFQKVKK